MRLTNSEKLYIKRSRTGLTAAKFAKKIGIDSASYRLYESGRIPAGRELPEIKDLKKGERCRILRRRYGLSQEQVGAAIGRCTMTIQAIETGRSDNLAEYEAFLRGYGKRA